MFALFGRKRSETPQTPPSVGGMSLLADDPPLAERDSTPEDQVELVCRTLQHLEQVLRLVKDLPELPLGNRQSLLEQLRSTSDHLRCLCFLDAIY